MSHFLSGLPLWALVLAVVVVPTSLAMGVQVFIRRSVGVERLALNNEVAGFIFAIIGVVYAVLLAFVVIAVWEKFSEGQTSVAKESAAAAALLYYSEGPEPEAAKLREGLVHYLHRVIEGDWPAMGRKSEDSQTTDALMRPLPRRHGAQSHRHAQHSRHVGGLYPNRQPDLGQTRAPSSVDRTCARDHLDHALRGRRFHRLLRAVLRQPQCAGAPRDDRDLSIVLAAGLVVIIALDHPFSGPVHITPEALEHVLASANTDSAQSNAVLIKGADAAVAC